MLVEKCSLLIVWGAQQFPQRDLKQNRHKVTLATWTQKCALYPGTDPRSRAGQSRGRSPGRGADPVTGERRACTAVGGYLELENALLTGPLSRNVPERQHKRRFLFLFPSTSLSNGMTVGLEQVFMRLDYLETRIRIFLVERGFRGKTDMRVK